MATILVIDDRPQNRSYLTRLIGHDGHHMIEADDGARALEQVRKEQPDLVITDILMPTMDGYEFVQRIRADPHISSTPIMFYSATYSAPLAEALGESCSVSSMLARPSEPLSRDAAGRPSYFVSVLDDISERKAALLSQEGKS
jgi:CheY-like chemotaxis protein